MNYAYSSPGISTSPWVQAMQGTDTFTHGFYNQNPDLGFDHWLRTLNPSLVDQNALRQLFPSMQRQWEQQQWESQINGEPLTRWIDFLGNYNADRELARLGSSAGRNNSRRFFGPTRVVTF